MSDACRGLVNTVQYYYPVQLKALDTTEGLRRAECKTFVEKIKTHTESLDKVLQDSQDMWTSIRSSVRRSDYDSIDGEDLSKALRTAMDLEELMALEPSGRIL